MTLSAEITAVNERLDLATGKTSNTVRFRLMTGVEFDLEVGAEPLRAIVQAFADGRVAAGDTPPEPATPSWGPVEPHSTMDAEEFGGDVVTPVQSPVLSGPRPTVVAPAPLARRVDKDEAGYPRHNGVDHRAILGDTNEGGERDEDGVGQI
jgi:hypothetical protein